MEQFETLKITLGDGECAVINGLCADLPMYSWNGIAFQTGQFYDEDCSQAVFWEFDDEDGYEFAHSMGGDTPLSEAPTALMDQLRTEGVCADMVDEANRDFPAISEDY